MLRRPYGIWLPAFHLVSQLALRHYLWSLDVVQIAKLLPQYEFSVLQKLDYTAYDVGKRWKTDAWKLQALGTIALGCWKMEMLGSFSSTRIHLDVNFA